MTVGVQVTTATRSAPSSEQIAAGSTFFVVGQCERGSTSKAQLVGSLSQFEELYGGRVPYGSTWDAIQCFFEEGGTKAYVGRTVGPSPSVSTLTLVDRAGTPVSTLRIDAVNAGAWGQEIEVAVANGDESDTFKLTITYEGDGNVGTEVYNNLATPAAAVTALENSAYVRGVNLASATAAPNNNPAVISATALASGSDDRTNITSTHYTNTLDLFDQGLGSGCVAVPGQATANVGSVLQTHARANNRLALHAIQSGQSKSQAITAVATAKSALGSPGLEYSGFFWPWVKVPDGSGATRTISPEGYVAAMRARAHEEEGPGRVPAGQIAVSRFVVDTETTLSRDDINDLNDVNISPIAEVNGAIQLYGWRSLSADKANYEYLTQRDVVNFVAFDLSQEAEQFVFRTIDGQGRLFSDVNAKITARLELLRAAGQLFERTDDLGNQLDPGYRVDTSTAVNTPATIAQNQIIADVSIRPSASAGLIKIRITKAAINGSV